MSELKQSGIIHKIFPPQQVNDSFKKQEIVLKVLDERDPKYDQLVKFELQQNRCDQLEHKEVGQKVTIHFDLRGRAWTNPQGETKYFTTLNAWRIEAEASVTPGELNPPEDASFIDELPF